MTLDIGTWIKDKRLLKGLSKSGLAEALGGPVDYIFKLENNERTPSLETLLSIAEVTGGKVVLK